MSAVVPARPVEVLVDDVWVPGWLIGWDSARQVGTVRYTREVELVSLTGPVSYSSSSGTGWFTWEQGRSVNQIRARTEAGPASVTERGEGLDQTEH